MFLEISEFAKVELCLGWVVFKGRCMKVFLIPICGAWRVKLDVILQQEELSWFNGLWIGIETPTTITPK